MTEIDPKHLTPEQFRTQGHQMVDLIAEYMDDIESYPVLSQVQPGQIYQSFPKNPPQRGESYSDVLEDVKTKIVPGLTHWQSPNFFAYFPTAASGPSILGDLLSSGLGVQGMLWSTSPACTELETLVLDWIVEIAGLPEHFHSDRSGGGVIQDSASSATLCAIVAAREQTLAKHPDKNLSDLTAYISNQTHSSAEKGLKVAGFRDNQIRFINIDEEFRIDPAHLTELIETDRCNGSIPAFICATSGTTSSLAFDPIPEIGKIAIENDIWLHIDAAHAGSAAVCPEHRGVNDGLENASSYCFNPHKWLLTNFDCSLFFVANKFALTDALTFKPEYLRNKASESGAVFDYSGWQIPLGRRFRSLKLWLVIRHYGIEGLQAHIRKHIRLAEEFSSWVVADDNYELFQPTRLNFVCFYHKEGNDRTKQILDELNASGRLFLTHSVLNDVYIIRFVVGAFRTEKHHIDAAWKQIKEAASS